MTTFFALGARRGGPPHARAAARSPPPHPERQLPAPPARRRRAPARPTRARGAARAAGGKGTGARRARAPTRSTRATRRRSTPPSAPTGTRGSADVDMADDSGAASTGATAAEWRRGRRPLRGSSSWTCRPTFVNHGAFGELCVRVQTRPRARRGGGSFGWVAFVDRALFAQVVAAAARLARFVGSSPRDLVLVPNATTGINAVVKSVLGRRGAKRSRRGSGGSTGACFLS